MSRKWEIFGHIYTVVLILCTVPILFFMFQLFMEVPELRLYFYMTCLVPIIGISVGIYGLIKTRGQK